MPRPNNLPLFKRKAQKIKNIYSQGQSSSDDDLVSSESEMSAGLESMKSAVQQLIDIHESTVDLDDHCRELLACPNYIGLSLVESFNLATTKNFAAPEIESVIDNNNPDSLIFEQSIEAGTLLNRDTIVRVKVAQNDTI